MSVSWRRFTLLLLTLLMASLGTTGCSGKHKLVPGAPEWVNQGGGAVEDAGAKVFFGVGAVAGISSPSLAVQTADQRARADIAHQLDTYVSGMLRDFQSSTSPTADAKGTPAPREEQYVENTLKTVTQVSVRGSRVVEHWKEPESGTLYSLVKLDLEAFKSAFEEIREIDPQLKTFVRSRADQAFDQLRSEERK